MDPSVLPWLQPVGDIWAHPSGMQGTRCGGSGGLYLMSAWFLHNKIFASLTRRSLLVIPFPTAGAGPWKWCSAEPSPSFHVHKKLFSHPHPSFLEEIQTYSLIRGFEAKGCRSVHESVLSIRDFQVICLAGRFAPICTTSLDPPGTATGQWQLERPIGHCSAFCFACWILHLHF